MSDETRNPAVPVALAVYAGIEGQAEPESDEDALRLTADWLDRIDDATDAEFDRAGSEHRVGRTVQARLRRIADRLAPSPPETAQPNRLRAAIQTARDHLASGSGVLGVIAELDRALSPESEAKPTDAYIDASGADIPHVSRSMQADLRALAARLPTTPDTKETA